MSFEVVVLKETMKRGQSQSPAKGCMLVTSDKETAGLKGANRLTKQLKWPI